MFYERYFDVLLVRVKYFHYSTTSHTYMKWMRSSMCHATIDNTISSRAYSHVMTHPYAL